MTQIFLSITFPQYVFTICYKLHYFQGFLYTSYNCLHYDTILFGTGTMGSTGTDLLVVPVPNFSSTVQPYSHMLFVQKVLNNNLPQNRYAHIKFMQKKKRYKYFLIIFLIIDMMGSACPWYLDIYVFLTVMFCTLLMLIYGYCHSQK